MTFWPETSRAAAPVKAAGGPLLVLLAVLTTLTAWEVTTGWPSDFSETAGAGAAVACT